MSRLFRLSKSELLLLAEASMLVIAVRAALWVCPYARVRHYLKGMRRVSDYKPTAARIARFVAAVSRFIPNANCLTQALAAEALLERHGHGPCLRIGVAKNGPDGLRAHAWVECGGDIVIGGDAVEGLTPLGAARIRTCP